MQQYTLIVVEENDPVYRRRWAMQNASYFLLGEGNGKYRVMKSKDDKVFKWNALVSLPAGVTDE